MDVYERYMKKISNQSIKKRLKYFAKSIEEKITKAKSEVAKLEEILNSTTDPKIKDFNLYWNRIAGLRGYWAQEQLNYEEMAQKLYEHFPELRERVSRSEDDLTRPLTR